MRASSKIAVCAIVTVLVTACSSYSVTPNAPSFGSLTHLKSAIAPASPACIGSREGMAQCDVLIANSILPHVDGAPPAGLSPSELQAAYRLPSASKGAGHIVAIVDA